MTVKELTEKIEVALKFFAGLVVVAVVIAGFQLILSKLDQIQRTVEIPAVVVQAPKVEPTVTASPSATPVRRVVVPTKEAVSTVTPTQ